MKWIAVIPLFLILSACCCVNSEVVEYRQVTLSPYQTVTVYGQQPVDMTTTTIQYY